MLFAVGWQRARAVGGTAAAGVRCKMGEARIQVVSACAECWLHVCSSSSNNGVSLSMLLFLAAPLALHSAVSSERLLQEL
jgi:hypothetical protein